MLAQAPLARLRRDLRSVCQSSSTRKSQAFTHTPVFIKGERKHLACVKLSVFSGPLVLLCFRMLLISSAFISTPTQRAFSPPHDWHSLSLPPLFPGLFRLDFDHTSCNFTNRHSKCSCGTVTSLPLCTEKHSLFSLLFAVVHYRVIKGPYQGSPSWAVKME